MGLSSKDFKKVRITLTEDYLFPSYMDEEEIESWFKSNNLNSYHCARDNGRIGGGKRLLDFKFVEVEDEGWKDNKED